MPWHPAPGSGPWRPVPDAVTAVQCHPGPDGSYVIRRELVLVTASGDSNPEVERFLAYCLNPAKGQAIIEKMGIVHAHAGDKS